VSKLLVLPVIGALYCSFQTVRNSTIDRLALSIGQYVLAAWPRFEIITCLEQTDRFLSHTQQQGWSLMSEPIAADYMLWRIATNAPISSKSTPPENESA